MFSSFCTRSLECGVKVLQRNKVEKESLKPTHLFAQLNLLTHDSKLSNPCNPWIQKQPYEFPLVCCSSLDLSSKKKAGNGFTQRQCFARLAMPLFHGWSDCCHNKGCWSVSQHDFWLAGGTNPFANCNRHWRSFCRACGSVFLLPVK